MALNPEKREFIRRDVDRGAIATRWRTQGGQITRVLRQLRSRLQLVAIIQVVGASDEVLFYMFGPYEKRSLQAERKTMVVFRSAKVRHCSFREAKGDTR